MSWNWKERIDAMLAARLHEYDGFSTTAPVRFATEAEKEAELVRAEGERAAEIIRAEGKAQALLKVQKIIAENPGILRYLYVDKISDKVKVIVLPANDKNLDFQSLIEDKNDTNNKNDK